MKINKIHKLVLLLITLSSAILSAQDVNSNTKMKTLNFNADKVRKNLTDSIQGVDAEAFQIGNGSCGINLKEILEKQPEEFKKFLNEVGRPMLRMMDLSRYSWRGPEATNALWGRKDTGAWWYSPEDFHKFCRENNIKIIGFFDTEKLYDVKTGKVVHFYNRKKREFKITPEQMDALVEENLYKLRWVKQHGYLDLYEGWEIGSENYIRNQDTPELYAEFTRKIAKAAKKIDPDIRLAINVFVCATDDDNLFQNSGINPRKIKGKSEWDQYNKWRAWSDTVMTLLGDDAKDIYYAGIHLYGPAMSYNANAKGLNTHVRIVRKHPNMQHIRFIVTEWRHAGTNELTRHRQFKTAALWKAKFSMVMLAHPLFDSTGVHEFLTFSGTGYWSDGSKWKAQWKSLNPRQAYEDKSNKKQFDIGLFGPVLRMLNKIVREYPLLLEHNAGLGEYSSAYFYEKCTPESTDKDAGRDLEWVIAANDRKDKFGGMVVNTHEYPVTIILQSNNKKYHIVKAETESCPADKLFECEVPGEKKFWSVTPLKVNSDGSLTLPPLSVTGFEAI